ncbi:MAG: hypothetical protein WBC73_13055 [Phormidesmis sp.]
MLNAIFEQFVEASPVSVMVRATMERIFSDENLDKLFEETAEKQYTKELLFSSVVGLMSLVVSGIHPSVNNVHLFCERLGCSGLATYCCSVLRSSRERASKGTSKTFGV